MTFIVGPARPRPGKVRPRPGPQPAKLLLTSPGPARACKFQARTRPGPQNIIESWPGPAHGLRAGPARGPRPGPCRTLIDTHPYFLNVASCTSVMAQATDVAPWQLVSVQFVWKSPKCQSCHIFHNFRPWYCINCSIFVPQAIGMCYDTRETWSDRARNQCQKRVKRWKIPIWLTFVWAQARGEIKRLEVFTILWNIVHGSKNENDANFKLT